MTFLLWPDEIRSESPVGGKAQALAQLTQAGLPIPEWFVLLPEASTGSIDVSVFEEIGTAEHEAGHPAIPRITINADALDALNQAVDAICNSGESLAIRSSAAEEDTGAHSFAGQLESYLFVDPANAATCVAKVWESGFTRRVMTYRRKSGLTALARAPAVIVQRMIEGDTSGVGFSADPVSGRRSVCVVTATWGLGDALVSGNVEADTWHVDADGRIVESSIARKEKQSRRDPDDPGHTRLLAVPDHLVHRPCLERQSIVVVAELAKRTERLFGMPQDIEWTFSGGTLYLLQSRPITTLTDKVDPDGFLAIWDNSNIIESYSGVTTPLTFSFAARAYEHVYRGFCRLMHVPAKEVAEHADWFRCMIGLVRGRVYYNLLNWYRILTLLPGFSRSHVYMEQMLGIRERLPAVELEELNTAAKTNQGVWRLVWIVSGIVWNQLTLGRRIRRFHRRLREVLGFHRPDLSRLRLDELATAYREIESRLLERWDAPVLNDFFLMLFHGALERCLSAWVHDSAGTIQNDLLRGERTMISKQLAQELGRLAAIAASRPSLRALLCTGSLLEIQRAISKLPELSAAYESYMDRFGDRCLSELKLESRTLHDDPLPLFRSIGQYAIRLHEGAARTPPQDNEQRSQREAAVRVRTALGSNWFKRLTLDWLLHQTRVRLRERENLRFERTRAFGRARYLIVEMGKRFAALDLIDEPHDIFYLELNEVFAMLEGKATTINIKALTALRKQEFQSYESMEPPAPRFETHGLVYVGHRFEPVAPASPAPGQSIKGLGCCAGVVRGPVRIVQAPEDIRLAPGEIIVAEQTDPGWIMIFPSAAGLLVERGSLLSHSAIIAREIGLPTIVALPSLTQWLSDGDWVEMNGTTGQVVRIAPPTPTQ